MVLNVVSETCEYNENKEIVRWTVIYLDENGETFVGFANKHPDDKYNRFIAFQLCENRAMIECLQFYRHKKQCEYERLKGVYRDLCNHVRGFRHSKSDTYLQNRLNELNDECQQFKSEIQKLKETIKNICEGK